MDLFTYGTLMSPDIMMRLAGYLPNSCIAHLHGFRCSRVKGEEYPGIRENAEGMVQGILYLDVPEAAVQRLDIFEGEMYERRQVMVQIEDGVEKSAMTYVFLPGYHDLLTEIPWDFEEFLLSGKKCFEDGCFGISEIEEGERG